MDEAFSRTALLLGRDAVEKLASRRVAVFGVGGVGSYAVEALARAGIGGFLLVDDDRVCISNINRQIHALRSTIGRPKVEVMRERVLDINPAAEVEAVMEFVDAAAARRLLDGRFAYAVDAIDTISAKIELVLRAKEVGVPIISAMGAGAKLDPTRLEVVDMRETRNCPLARVMRKELRRRGVESLKVVYSPEPPLENEEAADEAPRPGKKGVRGTVPFVPPVAGLIMAAEVVRALIAD